jgi:methionyl-tRNA formyltransferase
VTDDFGRALNEVTQQGPETGARVTIAGDQEFVAMVEESLASLRGIRTEKRYAYLDGVSGDLLVLVGYMKVVPRSILERMPVLGFHPSLLPRYRGGSAVKWQMHHQEQKTGVTVYRLVPGKLDAGPIVTQREIRPMWAEGESAGGFYRRARIAGVAAVYDAVRAFRDGQITYTPQDEARATWHPRLAPGTMPEATRA